MHEADVFSDQFMESSCALIHCMGHLLQYVGRDGRSVPVARPLPRGPAQLHQPVQAERGGGQIVEPGHDPPVSPLLVSLAV